MLYLVDGYNVTMRDPATSGRSKEGQREELLARLRVHAQSLAPGGTIVVVFDAHSALGRSSGPEGSVEGGLRDAWPTTRSFAGAEVRPGAVVVVTDDLRLRARISQDVGRHVEYRDGSSVFAETLRAASAHVSRRTGRAGRRPAAGGEQDHRGAQGSVADRGRLRGPYL